MPIGVGATTVTMKVCVTPFSVAVIGTLCPILSVAGGGVAFGPIIDTRVSDC